MPHVRSALRHLRGLAVLVLVEVWLRVGTLPPLARRLGVPLVADGAPVAAPSGPSVAGVWSEAAAWLAVVDRLSRWRPAGLTCLRRALVLGHGLRRHEPQLQIGVRRADDGELLAHAWVVVHGRSLDPESARFEPLEQAP